MTRQDDTLLLLAGPRDQAWVAAWLGGLPRDEWVSVAGQVVRGLAGTVLALPPSRWDDLRIFTEVHGGSWTVVSHEGIDGVHVLALPDTPPPVLVGEASAGSDEGRVLVAIGPVNIGWLLCWLRQHATGDHGREHSVGEMIAHLWDGLPANDEDINRPLVLEFSDGCWPDLVLFMARHRFEVVELPPLEGRRIWAFNPLQGSVARAHDAGTPRLRDPEV